MFSLQTYPLLLVQPQLPNFSELQAVLQPSQRCLLVMFMYVPPPAFPIFSHSFPIQAPWRTKENYGRVLHRNSKTTHRFHLSISTCGANPIRIPNQGTTHSWRQMCFGGQNGSSEVKNQRSVQFMVSELPSKLSKSHRVVWQRTS